MPLASDPDGSEDVNDFLKRIKELSDERDREDEERTRKLEEEIIQGRKERQARRAGECSVCGTRQSFTRPSKLFSADSAQNALGHYRLPKIPPSPPIPLALNGHIRSRRCQTLFLQRPLYLNRLSRKSQPWNIPRKRQILPPRTLRPKRALSHLQIFTTFQ